MRDSEEFGATKRKMKEKVKYKNAEMRLTD